MKDKKHRVKYYIFICLAGFLMISLNLKERTVCVTFIKSGKPVSDLTAEILVSSSPELNGKVFVTNSSGKIFIPSPRQVGASVFNLTFSNGEKIQMDIILPKGSVSTTACEKVTLDSPEILASPY